MEEINSCTFAEFREAATEERNSLKISNSGDCSSDMGSKEKVVRLQAPECMRKGNTIAKSIECNFNAGTS